MNSLLTRLSLALLLIMVTVGGGFYALEQWSAQRYHEEVTQRLNAAIAMYVTGETTLIVDGAVNREELERLAQRAMVINPSVEVYLVDRRGQILGHALPPESLQTNRVDLAPVRALIAGKAQLPLYGTDPRNTARHKVFSAAPVMDGDRLQGYLYVVLGGRQYDELAGAVRGSYVRQTSLLAIGALVVGGFLAGLAVFALLTRRLRALTRKVQGLSKVALAGESGAAELRQLGAQGSGTGPDTGDEISTLGTAFAAMANKIGDQFEALRESDRLRRELVGNVSHDLRTPLASMQGYIDTLLLKNDELDAAERRHYLQVAHKHTRRLAALVGDLLELSKLDAASMPLSLETFSLAELAHDVLQDFELEARRRGLALQMGDDPPRALVHADIALVQRVLENLIRNAIDNTPEGGSITLDISREAEQVAVTVADTGCGIPDEQLENIFERYVHGGNGNGAQGPSSGLGLAIVKRILDLHGSRITVASTVDSGTRFHFSLPVPSAA
jgi:signal transduction histidine kinase